jgi:hypothetical protein
MEKLAESEKREGGNIPKRRVAKLLERNKVEHCRNGLLATALPLAFQNLTEHTGEQTLNT